MGCRKRVLFAALIVFGTLVGASCASGDGDAEAVAAAEVGAAEAAVDTDAAADAMAAARAAVGTALPCSLIKTISWDVKANQAVGDVCTGYLGHFTDTQQQLYTCGKGLYCSKGDLSPTGTCATGNSYGDTCEQTTGCQSGNGIGAPVLVCLPQTNTCGYASDLGDDCQSANDCLRGSCTDGQCTGTLSSGDHCLDGAPVACGPGLVCVDAKCTAVLEAGADCEVLSAGCGPGLDCMASSTTSLTGTCTQLHSIEVGSPASNGKFCKSGVTDNNSQCTATRPGATVDTGGACSTDSDCSSVYDACVCTGGGNGVCKTIQHEYLSASASFASCMTSSECPAGDTIAGGSNTCGYRECGSDWNDIACATYHSLVLSFNGGEELDGSNESAFDAAIDLKYNCGALSTVAILLIIVGCIALLFASVVLVRRYLRNRNSSSNPSYSSI